MDLEKVFRSAAREGKKVDLLAVRDKKAEIIAALGHDLLEVVEPTYGFESVAGLKHVIRYLKRVAQAMQTNRNSKVIPHGILFEGVPGNGKTHIATAFAKESGMSMVIMKNIRSKWVGESEKNLETVFDVITSIGPTLIFVDEIDQALPARGSGSGDSGTSERMFGRILHFMADEKNRGKVLFIGASNRPDLLDAAMLSRFARVFPFLSPNQVEKVSLLKLLVQRIERKLASSVNLEEIAQLLIGLTGRAINDIVCRAAEISDERNQPEITRDALLAAAKDYKPNHNPGMYTWLTLLSVQKASFYSDLPWIDPETGSLIPGAEIPACLKDMVDQQGRLNEDLLAEKINQLALQLRLESDIRAPS